jgi:hypothetical protein
MKIILIDLTYPRAKTKAENLYEMAAEKGLEKERSLEFVWASREDSFSNLLPSEALEDDLQKVST